MQGLVGQCQAAPSGFIGAEYPLVGPQKQHVVGGGLDHLRQAFSGGFGFDAPPTSRETQRMSSSSPVLASRRVRLVVSNHT